LAFSILVLTLAMTVIGGRLSLAGAVLGALLLTHVPEWFRVLDRWYLLAYGAAMLAMIVFAPNGLAALIDGLAAPLSRRAGRLALPALPPVPAEAEVPPPPPSPAPAEGVALSLDG